jgi:hypothetical protein
MTEADWEAAFAPYDDDTYQAALDLLQQDDVVLDIGAGDLRFARRAAARCRRVIAIERRPELLRAGRAGLANLDIVCGDALTVAFPAGVTAGVLLMRHCRHVRDYAARLQAVGCRRLITNARWGMGVEDVHLDAPRRPYAEASARWYACECGATGFAPGPPGLVDPTTLAEVVEVCECPRCRPEPGRAEAR